MKERDLDENFDRSQIGVIKKEFGPLQFIDIADSREECIDSSKSNFKEAKRIISILDQFKKILDNPILRDSGYSFL